MSPTCWLVTRRCVWSTASRTTTLPVARHRKRYEDVEELLHAGISVITSINLEYIAEEQGFTRSILGRTKSETVPRAFINRADEVVVVDAPPEADSRVSAAQLSQLRQRALLLTAEVVDHQLEEYLETARPAYAMGHAGAHPRVHDAAGERRADAGKRAAECRQIPRGAVRHLRHAGEPDRRKIGWRSQRNVTLAEAQHAHVETLEGKDPIETILELRARSTGLRRSSSVTISARAWQHRIWAARRSIG